MLSKQNALLEPIDWLRLHLNTSLLKTKLQEPRQFQLLLAVKKHKLEIRPF